VHGTATQHNNPQLIGTAIARSSAEVFIIAL
jgi:hypothetical protein